MIRFIAITLFVLLFPVLATAAGNPLNLTPGTAATVTLGSIATLANFNTSTASSDISYSNADLATRTYVVRLPSGFNASDPVKKYGLLSYIDAGSPHAFPASYAAALDAHDVIWIAGNGIDNAQATNLRRGVALMGAFRMTELYSIDPARVYASGLSGGGRTASDLAYLRSDYLRGFIGRVGSSIPGVIPGFQTAGANSNVGNYDADYELGLGSSIVLPRYFRVALMSQYSDFRRSENLAIYRYGHLNHGNIARMVMRPGGHSDEVGPSFTDALDFLYHPLVDVIWDRFENQNPAVNLDSAAAKITAGSGFTVLSGNVSESTYTYNSSTHGVLRLDGDAAAAESKNSFTWKNTYGLLLDARLRAETAAGLNQQIGVHIIPASSIGPASAQPGFHVYWCYGQPHRAELVAADGTRKTLATWQHTATHPMNLATTLTSPQSGEGTVSEKTFWNSAAAPDYAGRTLAFRGEDMRIVLNSVGFQLTFNRPAVNLVTAYPGKVVTATTDTVTTDPNETFPILLQGFWSEVETALVNALPSGSYKLSLTNDALVSGQPVGNALVDEIHLITSSGALPAPPSLSVTPAAAQNTLAWTQIPGAMSYAIERADSPDGPFTTLAAAANSAASYLDATATQPRAYYYRVSAVGSDDVPGTASAVAFGTPFLPVSNSGFESPSQGIGTSAFSYNTASASWIFQSFATPSGSGISANSTSFTSANNAAPQGTQVAFCQGGGFFYQSVSGFNPGSSYKLTYAAAVRQSAGSVLQNWVVKRDTTTLSTVTTSGTVASNKPYTDRTVTFAATAASHQIVFGGAVANANATVFIDNIRIALQPPAAPAALAATFPSGPSPVLTWTDSATDETAYRLERSPAGLAQWSVLTNALAPGATSTTDNSAAPATAYDYRLSAVGPGGLSAYATRTITTPSATPLQSWRYSAFGTTSAAGTAADLADPDADGMCNLLEYALGTTPTDAASVSRPISSISTLNLNSYLQLTFVRARTDVSYIVEATSDLTTPSPWPAIATNPGTVGQSVTVTDPADLSANPRRFLRLRVTSP